jgi:phenylpyruvate tautomerase PptA (4-oxalocrotonate tautomerase family)
MNGNYRTNFQIKKQKIMPFVNIYLPAGFTQQVKTRISLLVHESLMSVFKIPEKDYFQVIHPVMAEHLIYPDNYLNVPHTANLIYIQVTCGPGRTIEMKQALYALIAEKIAVSTPVSANDVIIVLTETGWENWSFGQGIAQMIK